MHASQSSNGMQTTVATNPPHMKLDPGMNDSDMRRTFGLRTFEEGRKIAEKGRVSSPNEAHPSILVYEVRCSEALYTVLVRDYKDGRSLYDCDCGSDACRHMAAVLLSGDDSVEEECDEYLIDEISSMIDTVVDDILGDPDYDEEANYCDDWEIDKCGLENNNGDVEYEHVDDILTRILCEISDPDRALMLVDELIGQLSLLEIDNGGIEDAFFEHESDMASLFERISPDALAKVMKNTSYLAGDIYRLHIDRMPQKRLEEAYPLLDEESRLCDKALEMQF